MPLASGLLLATCVITWREFRTEQPVQRIGVQERARQIADRLKRLAEPALRSGSVYRIADLTAGAASNRHLAGLAVYDLNGQPLATSPSFPRMLEARIAARARCGGPEVSCGTFASLGGVPAYTSSTSLHRDHTTAAELTPYRDASALSPRSVWLWWSALWHAAPPVLLLALAAIAAVQLTVLRPIGRTARWVQELRTGGSPAVPRGGGGLLHSTPVEAEGLARSLASARAVAEKEARLRDAADSGWTAERLRIGVQNSLQGSHLFVVSNREPHEHVRRGKSIAALVPSSGLATALEPVLRVCDGTWIAHGSGNADREVVDERDRVRVPPDQPRYTLRRVWLSHEEQQGYDFGFANEGLWPLCHIAHTRPIFRAPDWEHYRAVNRKFAETVLQELEGTNRPFLLVQDYHLALLPAMVKEARPDARIALLWQIPWPNPEAFGICPWRRELLEGLLGADVVSFDIQAHCTNFLQTVDRFLDRRIEWERSAVNCSSRSTLVRAHPISIGVPGAQETGAPANANPERVEVRRILGVGGSYLALGVDPIDDTKGIVDRFRAVECLLDKYPSYREVFTLAQIGAPGRTGITRDQGSLVELEAEAQRINQRFQTGRSKPILLFSKRHEDDDIRKLFQASDMCLVTSFDDSMNLVAREFVTARDDEDGVLVLSQFAGPACELRDALVVNPYDVEQLAESLQTAIEMSPGERRSRMRHMRRIVREHNVYRRASELIRDLSDA
jgi:trehalose 6-phosphate synthase